MEDSKIHAVTLTTLTYGGEAMGGGSVAQSLFLLGCPVNESACA